MPTINFDGPNKIIEIGYDSSTTTVTVKDIYSRWKDWVKDGNAQWLQAFDLSVGGNDLGAGVSLDGYYFLRNDYGWRIRAADTDHTLVIDGQLFGFSTSTALYLARPGRTITYREQQSSRSQVVSPTADTVTASGSFQGKVWVNPLSAYAGSDFPNGTSVQPVNNVADAVTIANVYGIKELYVLNDFTLYEDVAGLLITGADTGVKITVDPSADVLDTTFDGVNVTGYFDGPARIRNGTIFEILDGFVGEIDSCHIMTGIKCIGDVNLHRCASGIPWQGGPYLDMQGVAHSCQVREYSGTIEIRGMVTGATLSVDLSAGRVIIDSSCTGGSIKVRGIGEPIVDNSGGAVTLDNDGFVVGGDISAAITEGVESVRYGEYVIVDAASGNTGTDYPNGTLETPVNNITDANAIAAARGISHLRFLSDYTFVSGDNVSLKTLCANSPGLVRLTFEPGAITAGTVFEDVTVEGTLVSPSAFKRCVIDDITGNTIGQVGLLQAIDTTFTGLVTLSSALSGTIELLDCTTSSNAATFDINGADVNVYLHRHSGDVNVQGFSRAGKIIHIQLFAGHIFLDSTCTDGTIEIHGGAELDDQSNGTTVVDLTENTDRANKRDETINKVAANVWAAS